MEHVGFHELAAGAALEDLDPEERRRLDDHRADCAECRSLGDQLEGVVGDLALLAPDMAPPRELHGAVLRAVRAADVPMSLDATTKASLALAEPVQISQAHGARPSDVRRETRSRPRWKTVVPLTLAAVIGIVAIGLGARVARLTQENTAAVAAVEDAQAQLAARDGAMAVLVSPGHQTVPLQPEALAPDSTAVAIFEPGTTNSYIMAANLPATPAGHVYQLWYADPAGVHPLGTYHHASGAFVAPIGVALAPGDATMITLEPDGGAVGAPGPQVVFGTL